MIKLVVFDLWNTLCYKPESVTRKLEKAFNIDMPHKEFVKLFESIVQTSVWETEYDAYSELLRALGINCTKYNIMKTVAIIGKTEEQIAVYDFTVQLLRQLKKKKIKIGLITNSSVFVRDVLKNKTKLLELIDYPIFSYELGTIKPDPVLFLEMQRLAGVTNPSEIIMIGDNLYDDIYPALKLGMNAIQFTGDYSKLKKELKKFGVNVR